MSSEDQPILRESNFNLEDILREIIDINQALDSEVVYSERVEELVESLTEYLGILFKYRRELIKYPDLMSYVDGLLTMANIELEVSSNRRLKPGQLLFNLYDGLTIENYCVGEPSDVVDKYVFFETGIELKERFLSENA